MSAWRSILLFLVTLLALAARAQVTIPNSSSLRQKTMAVAADSLQIDTISIIPNTLIITNIPAADYRLDFVRAVLYWSKKPGADSVTLTYRVFPFRLNPVVQRMPFDSIRNNLALKPYQFTNESSEEQKGIFNFGSLRAEGSFGRQLAFGNNQDAVLNSTLNLQLNGLLADSIEVRAAITDNNIPLQPDGATQQLNEFDQVILQFRKRNWQLSLGDIDIRQNQSYFLNFYKRLQGIAFQTSNRLGKNGRSETLASGSIAKGKFTRNIFHGLEGNQGPYRLTGANNEFFFIVLANTERVFINGQLLQRGEDQDYVINYNTAEISFTPKRMITKDSRIQVEFEYADRNFLNANFYLLQELEFQKLKLRITAFTNSDAKNSSINQVLNTEQRQFLASLGDSIQRAFYPSALPDTMSVGKILYEKKYYTTSSGLDSFYQYSNNPLLAKYSLSFTWVGEGAGNYIPDFNGANGKVYKFIEPVGGMKQGNYEPVVILVAPRKQQLISLGADYTFDANTVLKTEVAMSNTDVNTFSKKDNGDDKGFAAKFQLSSHKPLRSTSRLQLNTSLDYEYVQDKFKPLERLRTVEFSRDWGLPFFVDPATENILRVMAGITNDRNQGVTYCLTSYTRGDAYKGFQNALQQKTDWKGWQFNNEYVITHFNTATDKGYFLRPVLDFSKRFRELQNWKLGFRYAAERNAARNKATDTLTAASFSFDTYSVYLRSNEAEKNRIGITFFTRSDQYAFPAGKSFARGDRSYNLNLQAELLANSRRQFLLNATFRKLKVYNDNLSDQKEDETILGRAEYIMNEWKGLLTGNVLYEVGAGQEQRRDLAYYEVPAGTGQYAWIDYNNDGLQQLNEFELAAFPDQARFIRIFTPTNEFVKANYVTLNYSLNINPRSLLNKSDIRGVEKLLSRLNLAASLQINKKSVARGDFEFNPFKYAVRDTALVTSNTILLNTLSFNRYSPQWGIDLSNLRNNGKALLTYGYEGRRINDWTTRFRYNLSSSFLLNLSGKIGVRSLFTANPQFDNRNYELNIHSIEPAITYVNGTSFRLVTGYRYETKKNLPAYGGETSHTHSLRIESRYNVLQNSSVAGSFTFNNIRYSAVGNSVQSTVSYIMLDGLLPGKNYLWSFTLTRRLLNNLELNFQYDGRKPALSRTIHTGRASVTALF